MSGFLVIVAVSVGAQAPLEGVSKVMKELVLKKLHHLGISFLNVIGVC